MEKNDQESPGYKEAQKRVKDIKGFYIHLLVYLFVNTAIIIANSNLLELNGKILGLSNFYSALFWGIGLAAHWASVFGPGMILGKKWEEKKIRELMEKDKEQMQKWK